VREFTRVYDAVLTFLDPGDVLPSIEPPDQPVRCVQVKGSTMRFAKALGVACMAVLALSAFVVAAASADDLTAEKYPATLTGTNDPGFSDEFLTTIGTFKCTKTTYAATIAGPTTSLTATPSFSGCSGFGFPFVVDMNGCTFKFNVGAGTTGDVDLVCPAGAELTLTATSAGTAKCTEHIKAQSDITGGVTYSNIGVGATREITISSALSGIDYTHTAGTGLGQCTMGSAVNGVLNARAIFTGENDGAVFTEHIGVFMS
jgi:hypothetical protein